MCFWCAVQDFYLPKILCFLMERRFLLAGNYAERGDGSHLGKAFSLELDFDVLL